jgi:hypothetical protein
MGLLGIALAAYLALVFCQHRLDGADLTRIYQAGFARSAVRLLPVSDASPRQALELRRRIERADIVCTFDPERLRATPPYLLVDDGRFWPATNDAHPLASMDLRWDGTESGELTVRPENGREWKAPLRSKGLVQPDWSAYSGLVAYYDLGRVWIVDVGGKRYQSIVQEPLLDEGGILKFSADGTALQFYFHADKVGMAQELYVLEGRP